MGQAQLPAAALNADVASHSLNSSFIIGDKSPKPSFADFEDFAALGRYVGVGVRYLLVVDADGVLGDQAACFAFALGEPG